jgi:hypothetical protein
MDQPIKVGGEVEAWCGPCKGLHDHVIVSIVDDRPRDVECRSCGNRHKYRLDAARASGDAPKAQSGSRAKPSREELERRRRQEQQVAFDRELSQATDVKPFERFGRYKSGQIIEHPEHGRGKVESTLRGAILVRFRTGLKSVMTS